MLRRANREREQRLPWCRKWRVISTSTPTGAVRGVHLAPLAREAHARDGIRRARVTTPATLVISTNFYNFLITFLKFLQNFKIFQNLS